MPLEVKRRASGFTSTWSRVVKWKERGMVVGGCRISVAERWQIKLEALDLITDDTTFLSFSAISEVFAQ